MNPLGNYFLSQKEPLQSILLYLRQVIMETIPEVEEKYKYKIPMYYYKGKSICYLNILKNTNYVDCAFVFGYKLSNEYGLLKAGRKREYVRSITYPTLESVDVILLKEIILEAVSF